MTEVYKIWISEHQCWASGTWDNLRDAKDAARQMSAPGNVQKYNPDTGRFVAVETVWPVSAK